MRTFATMRAHQIRCLLVVLATTVTGAWGQDVTRIHIPADDNAYTSADFCVELLPVYNQMLADAYRDRGSHDAAWDEQAHRYLQSLAGALMGVKGAPSAAKLEQDAKALLDLGCDDGLVKYGHAYALHRQGKHTEAVSAWGRAARSLVKQEYDPWLLARAAEGQMSCLLALGNSRSANRMAEEVAELHFRALALSGADEPAELRVCFMGQLELMRDVLPKEQAQRYCDKILESKAIDPWLKHIIAGDHHLRLAWDARGRGWARDVPAEAWGPFKEQLALAREHLEAAHKLQPRRPEAATALISVAMGGGTPVGEDEIYWFNRAVAAQMDYEGAYRNLSWSLRPRWGGSHRAMFRFGLACMETERYDTTVPYRFIDQLLAIKDDSEDYLGWEHGGVYAAAAEVLEGYAAQVESSSSKRWYRSLQAAIAWRCGKNDAARSLCDALDGDLSWDAVWYMDIAPRHLLSHVHALTGPAAPVVESAEQASNEGAAEEAKSLYRQALEQLDEDDPGRILVQSRLDLLQFQDRFQTGDWLSLRFDANHPGWTNEGGEWWSRDWSEIRGLSRGDGLLLVFDEPVGCRFEVKATIHIESHKYAKYNSGIAFAYRDVPLVDYRQILLYPGEGVVKSLHRVDEDKKFSRKYGTGMVENPTFLDRNVVHLQVWDNRACCSLNDQVVYRGTYDENADTLPEDGRFAIGGDAWYDGTVIRVSDVQVRLLSDPPAWVRPN